MEQKTEDRSIPSGGRMMWDYDESYEPAPKHQRAIACLVGVVVLLLAIFL